jgi:hypothetical protein
MDLATELQKIYDSEINIEIGWFWDGGIDVRARRQDERLSGRGQRQFSCRYPPMAPGGDCSFLPNPGFLCSSQSSYDSHCLEDWPLDKRDWVCDSFL